MHFLTFTLILLNNCQVLVDFLSVDQSIGDVLKCIFFSESWHQSGFALAGNRAGGKRVFNGEKGCLNIAIR